MSFGQKSGPACLGKLWKFQQGKFLRTSWSNICQGGKPSWSCIKLWDGSVEGPSSPVLSEPMEFPTARGEFARISLALLTWAISSSQRRSWWWDWASVTETCLFAKDRQSSVSLNPVEILQEKPISLLTVFRLLPASSQIKISLQGILMYPQC